MLQWFWNIVDYDATPVVFASAYGLNESVRRLAVASSLSPGLFFAIGTVTAQKVSLRRGFALGKNGSSPVFMGKFQQVDDKVQLVGSFSLGRYSKFYFAFCFCFMIILIVGSFFKSVGTTNWWMPLSDIGMLIVWVSVMFLGRWLARNDIARLSQLIEKAQGTPE